MPDQDQWSDNVDAEMEHDTEVRRETQVRDALGPIEGTDAERNAAESALSPEERRDAADEHGDSSQQERE